MTKVTRLRHNEYYSMQETFDKLYADSKQGKVFENLMELITRPENIKLAYRNIKRNKGSNTSGTDKCTIEDIKALSTENYIEMVQRKLKHYKPKPVRRVEIPKPNGKMRPDLCDGVQRDRVHERGGRAARRLEAGVLQRDRAVPVRAAEAPLPDGSEPRGHDENQGREDRRGEMEDHEWNRCS